MKILLDTVILIRALMEPDKLSPALRDFLETSPHIFFSNLSIIEISIKKAAGKFPVVHMPSAFYEHGIRNGWHFINFDPVSADIFSHMPVHHNDPFDRMLVAQAIQGGMAIATTDKQFKKYNIQMVS